MDGSAWMVQSGLVQPPNRRPALFQAIWCVYRSNLVRPALPSRSRGRKKKLILSPKEDYRSQGGSLLMRAVATNDDCLGLILPRIFGHRERSVSMGFMQHIGVRSQAARDRRWRCGSGAGCKTPRCSRIAEMKAAKKPAKRRRKRRA